MAVNEGSAVNVTSGRVDQGFNKEVFKEGRLKDLKRSYLYSSNLHLRDQPPVAYGGFECVKFLYVYLVLHLVCPFERGTPCLP